MIEIRDNGLTFENDAGGMKLTGQKAVLRAAQSAIQDALDALDPAEVAKAQARANKLADPKIVNNMSGAK